MRTSALPPLKTLQGSLARPQATHVKNLCLEALFYPVIPHPSEGVSWLIQIDSSEPSPLESPNQHFGRSSSHAPTLSEPHPYIFLPPSSPNTPSLLPLHPSHGRRTDNRLDNIEIIREAKSGNGPPLPYRATPEKRQT